MVEGMKGLKEEEKVTLLSRQVKDSVELWASRIETGNQNMLNTQVPGLYHDRSSSLTRSSWNRRDISWQP